jgi:hypothetical protein
VTVPVTIAAVVRRHHSAETRLGSWENPHSLGIPIRRIEFGEVHAEIETVSQTREIRKVESPAPSRVNAPASVPRSVDVVNDRAPFEPADREGTEMGATRVSAGVEFVAVGGEGVRP